MQIPRAKSRGDLNFSSRETEPAIKAAQRRHLASARSGLDQTLCCPSLSTPPPSEITISRLLVKARESWPRKGSAKHAAARFIAAKLLTRSGGCPLCSPRAITTTPTTTTRTNGITRRTAAGRWKWYRRNFLRYFDN